MNRLEASVDPLNTDQRCPLVLLLDTSGSMSGPPIDELTAGLRAFQEDIKHDDLAGRRCEIAIVTFGNSGVQTVQDFVTADQFEAPVLEAAGGTPMGPAIHRALDMLRTRKDAYRSMGITHYRPWIFLITDGEPTDNEWQAAGERVQSEENANSVAFFAVGVQGANMQKLAQLSKRQPVMLNGLNFRALFLWLSGSMSQVSHSAPGQTVGLAPIGWGSV